MTIRHYLESDALSMEARVLACIADDGRYRISLDTTLFHPQGGGQPADSGVIGDAQVLSVIQDENGITHFTDRELPEGKVFIQVNMENRKMNTRMHSAGHLIGYVGEQAGWKAQKANHRPGEGRVVFAATEKTLPLTVEKLSEQVKALVSSKLLRQQYFEGETRWITWGDLPPYACGGTHVISTDKTGDIEITAVKLKKGALSVSYALV